jgi:hypothetical protein
MPIPATIESVAGLIGEDSMNTSQVLVRGTLNPDGVLVLEETPALPPGPVEVVIRALPASGSEEGWWEYLQRCRAEMLAQGHRFRSREEIDAERAHEKELERGRQQALRRLQSNRE